MDKRLIILARTGFAAKGAVFGIAGVLVLMAALNLGATTPSLFDLIEYFHKQPFGKGILVAMGTGFTAYAIWKMIEGVYDPEQNGTSLIAIIGRIGFFFTGLTYLGLAFLAMLQVIGASEVNDVTNEEQAAELVPYLVTYPGLILLGITGAVIVIIGIVQIVIAFQAKYINYFDLMSTSDPKRRRRIKIAAKIGMTARALIFLIIGYFAIRAALTANPDEIKTTSEAFSFVEESDFGAIMLGCLGLGFMAFAVYMFLLAKHRKFGTDHSVK